MNPDAHTNLTAALQILIDEDTDLFFIKINEHSLTHKLAEYLQPLFKPLKVDCEYNRHIDAPKELPEIPGSQDAACAITVYPDIIVHERINDCQNLLVIEAKKSSNIASSELDYNKLSRFQAQPFAYKHAAFVYFVVGESPSIELRWRCTCVPDSVIPIYKRKT